MPQRYLVDVVSDAHRIAVENNLSYIEGIVYNDIAFVNENLGEAIIPNASFLHISEKDYMDAIYKLEKLNLIAVEGNKATLKRYSLDELANDPLLATMMAAFINQVNLNVSFDPLHNYKKEEGK